MKITTYKLARRKGVTLIEITLVLALAAIVAFVGLRAYSQAQANSKVQQAIQAVGQLRAAVESVYQGQPNYTALSAAAPNADPGVLKALPLSLTNATPGTAATNIVGPYRGNILVASNAITSAGDSYSVLVPNIPDDACVRIASSDFGRNTFSVSVAGAALVLPVTSAAASAACVGGAALNTIMWVFQ